MSRTLPCHLQRRRMRDARAWRRLSASRRQRQSSSRGLLTMHARRSRATAGLPEQSWKSWRKSMLPS
ncbi:protein OBERON 3-like [Iris pallida]|uniref:Protein OBERON 3-like n=1 Tax=Iris pallida TaxID=29817 RepID=A0AAX6HV66_IRIPA|nr:protein OBERON 3-like [Iris pallida]